jgi:hypothetical protein
LLVESCTEAVKRGLEPKAEQSPLLKAVFKEQLMKTQQAGKRLSGCCDDL